LVDLKGGINYVNYMYALQKTYLKINVLHHQVMSELCKIGKNN